MRRFEAEHLENILVDLRFQYKESDKDRRFSVRRRRDKELTSNYLKRFSNQGFRLKSFQFAVR